MTTYWITLAIVCVGIGIIWGIRKYKSKKRKGVDE